MLRQGEPASGVEAVETHRTAACLAILAALGMLLTACSGDDTDQPEEDVASPISVQLGFTQLLPDEGTSKGLLRVVNTSDEPLPVTGAGLDWSGYGPRFTRAQDATLAPGQTLDLHVLLPPTRCDDGDEPISGVVQTADATKVQPLTKSGQEFLHRLWLRRCQHELVDDNVRISYAPGWRIDPTSPSVDGALVLERQGGQEPVTVTYGRGSVLYDVELPDKVTSTPDDDRTLVPLRILPGNRCDEHAIGQATAPFTFRVGMRVGGQVGGVDTNVLVPPPESVQEQATRMLLMSCAHKSGG